MTLPFGAEATVGGVINIGNGESIRFELSGSIRTEEELAGLLAGFDATLGRLGRTDELTRTAVDGFRQRVFGEGNGKKEDRSSLLKVAEAAEAYVRKVEESPAYRMTHPEATAPKVTETPREPAPVAKAEVPKTPQATAPQVFVCDDCEGPVTEADAKTARLFYSACLCKACQKARNAG